MYEAGTGRPRCRLPRPARRDAAVLRAQHGQPSPERRSRWPGRATRRPRSGGAATTLTQRDRRTVDACRGQCEEDQEHMTRRPRRWSSLASLRCRDARDRGHRERGDDRHALAQSSECVGGRNARRHAVSGTRPSSRPLPPTDVDRVPDPNYGARSTATTAHVQRAALRRQPQVHRGDRRQDRGVHLLQPERGIPVADRVPVAGHR